MADKLSPWFPPSIKPVHIGVYERNWGDEKVCSYAYWNGFNWGHSYDNDVYRAFQERDRLSHRYDLQWRGLARKPK